MKNMTLYAYSEEQIEKIVEKVISKYDRKLSGITNEKEIPESDKLTQDETAKFLNRSVQTLIEWKKKKKIPYYQIGSTIFYSKSEILAFARQRPKQFNHL